MIKKLKNSFVARVLGRYGKANGGTWATSVAWNLLFSFFPIALIVLTVAGTVLAANGGSQSVANGISNILPNQQGVLLTQALRSFHHSAGPLLVVSIAGLLWSGSSLFGAIDSALDALHHLPSRSFVSQKLMAVVMIVIFTVLILVAITTSSVLAFIDNLSQFPAWMKNGPAGFLLQIGVGFVDFMLLLMAIYYVVPKRRPPIRALLVSSAAAGLLLELFTLLFPLYFKLQHGFSTYGSTFGLFFLLMTYAYFLAQIIVLGGAMLAELDPGQPSPESVARNLKPASEVPAHAAS